MAIVCSCSRSSAMSDPSMIVIDVLPTPPLPPSTATENVPAMGAATWVRMARTRCSSGDSPVLTVPNVSRYSHLRQP